MQILNLNLKELFKLFELLSYITNWLFKIKEKKQFFPRIDLRKEGRKKNIETAIKFK